MAEMTPIKTKQSRLKLGSTPKTGVRTQFGALCWRVRKGKLQVLLVKTRRRKRWIIPKGWPMHNATPMEAAATEAFEEAGVQGKPSPITLGIYSYKKYKDPEDDPMQVVVAVFPLKVKTMLDDYPEKGQRKRKWFTPEAAAERVDSRELAQMLRNFDPRPLKL
ncbi:NUDIX hydrolase [Celeribacter sp.]|uniref:NUDIX hydrolase n=1 Tax=Celeribacter sp. TaxID=1890673 RepID=UPI003A93D1D9